MSNLSSMSSSLMLVSLTDEEDVFKWSLTPTGLFSVKLMYLHYMNGHTPFLRKYLWKLKVPLKIKIFMWFVHKKVILTKDNLLKRQWNGCKRCAFCQSDETVEHLFIHCPVARNIWQLIHLLITSRHRVAYLICLVHGLHGG